MDGYREAVSDGPLVCCRTMQMRKVRGGSMPRPNVREIEDLRMLAHGTRDKVARVSEKDQQEIPRRFMYAALRDLVRDAQ
jgi:hypothetical protein